MGTREWRESLGEALELQLAEVNLKGLAESGSWCGIAAIQTLASAMGVCFAEAVSDI